MAMSVQEAYTILNKLHGYTGPRTKRAISNFINARDIPIAVKNRGGMVGYQEGGDVPEEEKKPDEQPKEYTEEDLAKGQEKLMGDVFTDPSKALKKPEVEKIDPTATGTLIGTGVTRDYKQVDAADAGFKPPAGDGPVTQAQETFYNPTTGETVTVPTGGYTPPEGFVRGSPEGKFTEPKAGQASGTVDKATTTTVADADIEQADAPKATAPKQKVKQKVDAEGNPVLDAEGNPIFEGVVDEEGNPIYEDDIEAIKSKADVKAETDKLDAKTIQKFETDAEGNLILDAEGNPIPRNKIEAETKDETDVSDLEASKIKDADAAQIDKLTDKTKRKLQDKIQKRDADGNLMFDAEGNPIFEESELIKGTGVDTAKVEEVFGEGEVEAASVKDELTTLMDEFDDGQTPPWAAGSMRKAMQTLAARGLGASSLAGQAVIQAAMEAALPIAQIDASNKQEMAVLKAEQRAKFMQQDFDQAFEAKVKNAARISEIADINFTAEQQIALENAKLAQTTNIANLEASNALVLAEAAATSALELENLSNQNKARVENARNFLQIDLANLDNEQETSLFKAQKQIDAILTDVASENSALQFNATSRQQAEQFDESLTAQVKQFNTNQKNAIKQFNAGEENATEQFNTAQQNARDQFNAENDLVIAQANAKWRQDTETINTATENQATFEYAKETNGLTNKAIDTMWQRERDLMSFAFTASEAALDRAMKILLGDKTLEGIMSQVDATEGAAKANLFARLFFGNGGLFGDDESS